MSGPYSGKFGVVDGQSTVRDWSINDAMDPKKYVASNTKFGQGSRRGVESWDGNFQHYGHTPLVLPGEQFSFLGYGSPINRSGGAGFRYAGDALVETAVINWNWAGGDILSVQVNFKGHLNLTEQGSSGAQIFDQTIPTVPVVACTKIEYSTDDGVTFTEWENLVTAALTLSSKLVEYVDSSTVVDDSGTCRIWKGQRPGSIAWVLAVTEQNIDRSIFKKGDSLVWRCWVNGTEFYLLKWGMVEGFTNISVNPETNAIIQQTVNIGMDGFDPAAGNYSNATGGILLPDASVWWPFGTGT